MIRNELKSLRSAWKADQVGAALGVSGKEIKRWERTSIPPQYQQPLADLLGVTVEFLTGRGLLPTFYRSSDGAKVFDERFAGWLGGVHRLAPQGCGDSDWSPDEFLRRVDGGEASDELA